jgi:hypothetical protein
MFTKIHEHILVHANRSAKARFARHERQQFSAISWVSKINKEQSRVRRREMRDGKDAAGWAPPRRSSYLNIQSTRSKSRCSPLLGTHLPETRREDTSFQTRSQPIAIKVRLPVTWSELRSNCGRSGPCARCPSSYRRRSYRRMWTLRRRSGSCG